MNKIEIPPFDTERAESPTRRALEQTRLSRLPPIPSRAGCENCTGRLDAADEFQIAVGLCKSCLKTYAAVGSVIEKYTEAKIRRNYWEAK